jgi:hypothetical protein
MPEVLEEVKPVAETKKTSFLNVLIVGAIIGAGGTVGVDQGLVEPAAQAKIEAFADSVAAYDSTVDYKADSINADNVKPARYAAVRPEQVGSMKSDKFNPLYYHAPDEFVIVKTYRGRQGSKDTTLINSVLVEADEKWLLDVKARAVMENPTVKETENVEKIQ